ncbi:MarR family winged helix-turn-helix transcriptional regulator [Leucobacter tardus]|uniref:Winged helix-turn-helix transcriptional regulator n=1 Tax=Leucobacter tardus TaxID=501483 RepID=A0A939QIR3_9MICO|nr:MarR family winged helix-turn-helix transcriptional regulator [Leucobacter tardus]MBO2988449.1 winged helix-turn-helix transcriptional regulator [Leucobacter tardus]
MALDSSTTAVSPSAASSTRLWDSAISDDVSFLLARANAVSMARTRQVLGPFGLKVRSYALLGIVAADTRPSQRELSEFLRLDPSQIVSLVDELQTRGLARREPDPRDRRANVVVATDAGVTLFAEAREQVLRAESAWLADLPREIRDRFGRALAQLATTEDDS